MVEIADTVWSDCHRWPCILLLSPRRHLFLGLVRTLAALGDGPGGHVIPGDTDWAFDITCETSATNETFQRLSMRFFIQSQTLMMAGYTQVEAEEEDSQSLVTVDQNKVMFYSDVTNESCLKLIQCIDKAKKHVAIHNAVSELGAPMHVFVHICSCGGDLYAALSVIDTILASTVGIVTVCEGCVASAAVLIALAGSRRLIRAHAYMLIHEIRSVCAGRYSECQDDMRNSEALMAAMQTYISERCANARLERKLDAFLRQDRIWDSKKCLKYGLVDSIV